MSSLPQPIVPADGLRQAQHREGGRVFQLRPRGRAADSRPPHLRALESEAVHVLREVVAGFARPVLLFSGGKDSIVLLRLAEKAFRPGRFPFPLLSDISSAETPTPVHREYGAFDENTNQPREGVFVVDRAGLIQHSHFGPDRLGAPADWVHELGQAR